MYQDKTLTCKECGNEFVFSSGEQAFYEEKGFQNEPERCKSCRTARKNQKNGQHLHIVPCAACGADAKIPFIPTEDRPVYCSECFSKIKQTIQV